MKGTVSISLSVLMAFFLTAITPCIGDATSYTLIDANSTANVVDNSSMGMNGWVVNGINHLHMQNFWYRIGPTGGEQSIGDITNVAVNHDLIDYLKLTYYAPTFNLTVKYMLTGGNPSWSQTADMAESIRITNTSKDALDFHFFQYSDFDLAGTAYNDTAYRVNPNKIVQTGDGLLVSEIVYPDPNHWEISLLGQTHLKLLDSNPTTLSDSSSPLGPGYVEWAFQWDVVINPGDSFVISIDKLITVAPAPVPASVLLLSSGLLGLIGFSMIRKS